MAIPKKKALPPYQFVIDYLAIKEPVVKRMFGCFAIYVNGKLVLILRKRKDHPSDNGVWLATTHAHHQSLRKDFPSMRSIKFLGKNPTGWQVLPEKSADFEEAVIRACELIVRGDVRIGKKTTRQLIH